MSYSRRNKPAVERLARDLAADGFDVWFDDWSIHGGESIIATIEAGLQSADYVIPCFSVAWRKSLWAQEEVRAAISSLLSRRKPKLVPVVLDNPSAVPMLLRHRKYIVLNKRYSSGYGELKNALTRASTKPTSASHRFMRYERRNIIRSDGSAIYEHHCIILPVGGPLKSLQIPFHTTELPKMQSDNIKIKTARSAEYQVEKVSGGKDFLLSRFVFSPPLATGRKPVTLNYSYIVKRSIPTSMSDMLWQRDHGCRDWHVLFDGVLLSVPASIVSYDLRLDRNTYSTPRPRITAGAEGPVDHNEFERLRRIRSLKIWEGRQYYHISFTLRDPRPGVFYGAEWDLR